MKKQINIILTILILAQISFHNSCTNNEFELLDGAKPGYLVTLDPIESFVSGAWDLSTATIIYDSVYFYAQYNFPEILADINYIIIRKELYDDLDNLLSSTNLDQINQLPHSLIYEYNTIEELFDGLNYPTDSLKPDYYFSFNTVAYLPNGDSIKSSNGVYNLVPSLSGFCPLPDIPSGIWTAKNHDTEFTVEVVIRNPSPYVAEDDGRLWISNFGMDWSGWNDKWYTIEFKLNCPKSGDPRYVIELLPDGNWGIGDWTGIDRTGAEVTKEVYIMPYLYTDDTESIGYYDPDIQEIRFENVSLYETWWNLDNHTVNISFKYKGPE
jgi:hypothetical protein